MPAQAHPYTLSQLVFSLKCHPISSPAVHALSFKLGFLYSSVFFGNNLMQTYSSSSITLARKLFDEIPQRNSVSWSTIILGYVKIGFLKEAVDVFREMSGEVDVDFFSVKVVHASMVKGCSREGDFRTGSQLHCNSIKLGFDSDSFMAASLIDLYWKCDDIVSCKKVFDFSPQWDVATWTTMISALASQLQLSAFSLFRKMIGNGVYPVEPTIGGLVKLFDQPGQLNQAKQVHACMVKFSVQPSNRLVNALVTAYGKCGGIDELVRLAARAPQKDLILFTFLLTGLIKNGCHVAGIQVFREMVMQSEPLDGPAVVAVMEAFSALKMLLLGKEVHGFSIRRNLTSNPSLLNALMNLYTKFGHIQTTTAIFHSIEEENISAVNYTAMLTCYAQSSQSEDAMSLFQVMLRNGVRLHYFDTAAVISVCAALTGKQVHGLTLKTGLFGQLSVRNSLITMYGKCGDHMAAEEIFETTMDKDRITWNSMIGCCACYGFGQKAVILFYRMQREGFEPDDFTFLGVLTSCSHAGLVDEGREFFKMMGSVYGLEPKTEHLACMVDLLGRAGRFEEAVDLVNASEESLLVWESLVGCCSIHGERDIGSLAMERIVEFRERSACGYIAWAKVSALNGDWKKKAEALTFMRQWGLKKEAARSWVEVNGGVHVFSPDDKSHPQIFSIYLKLEELRVKMEELGYVADTRLVCHDTSEEEREISLLRHSEKLALAFALMVTSKSQRTVKILQNVRCCADCHVAMKLVSRIESRRIILRDSKRFHIFVDGSCSCGDYW